MTGPDMLESQRVRQEIRAGRITGTSRGLAHGFVQCNLAILPKEYAFDFLLYCQRNQRACPVLEVTDPGEPGAEEARAVGRSAHRLRALCDLSRRRAHRGPHRHHRSVARRPRDVPDRLRHQHRRRAGERRRADPQGPLGAAHHLADRAGGPVPRRHDRHHALAHRAAGDHRDAGHVAVSVQSRRADPSRRSGRDRRRSRQSRCSAARCRRRRDGIVPVFWACGVTPQSAAENARLPFFIAHAPAHSFITDLPAQALMNA